MRRSRLIEVFALTVGGLIACTACGAPQIGNPDSADNASKVEFAVSPDSGPPASSDQFSEATSSKPVDVSTIEQLAEPEAVTVTGYRIGDRIEDGRKPSWIQSVDEDENVLSQIPPWVAVSRDGVIIGYQYNDPKFDTMTGDEIVAAGHPELWILDETGDRIGAFVDGRPVLEVDG